MLNVLHDIYLWHANLKLLAKLKQTILRKPRAHEVILLLEILFKRFKVINNFEEIKTLAPDWMCSPSSGNNTLNLKRRLETPVGNSMAVPKPLLWAKNNNPEEWWNVNDFEILCAFYQHKVEEFLKMVSPYFPRGSKSENDIPELHTPSSFTGQNTSVSELPAPRRAKVQRFGNDGPSISSSKGNPEGQTDEENPFSSKGNFKDLKEPKKIIPVTSQPPRHPSDDSDSDSEPAKPPKPPCLTK